MFVCDICSEFGLFKDGVYRCSECYYDVHIKCIQDKHKEKVSEKKGIIQEEEEKEEEEEEELDE